MERAGSLLPKILRKRGLFDEATASLVVHRAQTWLKQAFPDLAGAYAPKTLEDGVLTIAASHPIAQQEGALRAAELLAYLQEDPAITVRDIRWIRA